MKEEDIFFWKNFRKWRRQLLKSMEDIFTGELIKEFSAHPPESVVSDDMDWLEDLIYKVSGESVEIIGVLMSRLRQRYSYLRAFHACCPTDPDSYYKKGLVPLNLKEFKAIARRCFSSREYPEVTNKVL